MRAGAVVLLVSICIMWGCEESDLTRPQSFIHSPTEGDTLFSDSIPWLFLFTDDIELAQYRLELNGRYDVNGAVKDSMEQRVFVGDASGTEVLMESFAELPRFMYEGWYRVLANCVDNGGNQSLTDTVSVYLRNREDSQWPEAGLSTVTWGDTIQEGRDITYNIDVTDDLRIWKVRLDIVRAGRTDTIHRYSIDSTYISGTDFEHGGIQYFNADWEPGVYQLRLKVWDCCHLSQRTDSVYVK